MMTVKINTMKKPARLGDALKGAQIISRLSKQLNFEVDVNRLWDYIVNVKHIYSFKSYKELLEDMIKTFCLVEGRIVLNIYEDENCNIVDTTFDNSTITVGFLNYAFNNFFSYIVEEVLYRSFVLEDFSNILTFGIRIPASEIKEIYKDINYGKIELFIEELHEWLAYNRISYLDEDSFWRVKNDIQDELHVTVHLTPYC